MYSKYGKMTIARRHLTCNFMSIYASFFTHSGEVVARWSARTTQVASSKAG